MPGRRTPPMPDRLSPQWWISALTKRYRPVAGTGMDEQACRFVDDHEFAVLVEDDERNVLALRLGRFGLRQADRDAVAGRTFCLALSVAAPLTLTAPASISALMRLRDRLPSSWPASQASSRPSASSPAISALKSPPHEVRKLPLFTAPCSTCKKALHDQPNFDDDDDKPLDPVMERVRRKMVRLQIVSAATIVVSLMAVWAPLSTRQAGAGRLRPPPVAADLALPEGASLS